MTTFDQGSSAVETESVTHRSIHPLLKTGIIRGAGMQPFSVDSLRETLNSFGEPWNTDYEVRLTQHRRMLIRYYWSLRISVLAFAVPTCVLCFVFDHQLSP